MKPFQIGGVRLANPWIMAPMAGVSEWPYRVIAVEHGASAAPTELVSARAMLEGTCVVRWGLDSGLPVSASLGADETVQMSVRVQPPGGEQAEQTMRMKGRLLNGIRFRTMPLSPPQRSVGR